MTDDNSKPNIVAQPPIAPQPPTTVEGFIYSLGSVVNNLKTKYRMSENGALKTVQTALEYDLNRRNWQQPDVPQQEVNVGSASE